MANTTVTDTDRSLFRELKKDIIGNSLIDRIDELEKKVEKLIDITQRYYDFWLHGTALEPIYKSFIDDLEDLKKENP